VPYNRPSILSGQFSRFITVVVENSNNGFWYTPNCGSQIIEKKKELKKKPPFLYRFFH
jgi:hypothetical protein